MNTSLEKFKVKYSDPLDLTGFSDDPVRWLLKQPPVGETAWLLAYANDGVIWGKLVDQKLIQAYEKFGGAFPKLDVETLQHAHLFGPQGEIRIFHHPDGWRAIRIEDEADDQMESFTRSYILWGDTVQQALDHWAWVRDGQLGIHQALPLEYPDGEKGRKFKMDVRYYIEYEPKHGQASITASRLTALKVGGVI